MDLMAIRRRMLFGQGIQIMWDAQYNGRFLRDDGSDGSNLITHVSNAIPVSFGNYVFSFYITDLTARTYRIHEYDANGNWVRMLAKTLPSTTGRYELPFTTNGSFIRISAPKATVNYSLYKKGANP